MARYIPLILTGVFLNAAAQVCLKKGMISIGRFSFSLSNIIPVASHVAVNPFILLGILCYIISLIVWILVLSRVDVSFAYPFLSVGYVVITIVGYTIFNENISALRIGGVLLICLGLIFVARS